MSGLPGPFEFRNPMTASRFLDLLEGTPTPWRVNESEDWIVYDANGAKVIDEEGTSSYPAAVIVRAVNTHAALLGIAQYAKHLRNCAAIRTNGGLNAPGPCDCGLDLWLARLKEAERAA